MKERNKGRKTETKKQYMYFLYYTYTCMVCIHITYIIYIYYKPQPDHADP